MKKKGFTLIELLVVIAIIALLLAILMPSLRRVKEAGKRIQCMNNTKTFAAAMMLYVKDYENKFPSAKASNNGWIDEIPGYKFNPWEAPKEDQLEAIRRGLLFSYVENTDVYKCPVAKKNHFRTYSLPHSINGFANDGGTILQKITQAKNTSGRMLFLDDYIYDYDSAWMIWYSRQAWWNTTPIRHGSGGNVFSYLDGHSDFHLWKHQDTIDWAIDRNAVQKPDGGYTGSKTEDMIWAQRAVWGDLGYTPTP